MSYCYRCGAECRTAFSNGKLRELNKDNDREHWRDCAAAGPNRHPAKLRPPKQTSFLPSPSGRRSDPKKITGRDFTPACGECSAPPWETCACSLLIANPAEEINREADERLQLALEMP